MTTPFLLLLILIISIIANRKKYSNEYSDGRIHQQYFFLLHMLKNPEYIF